jgi:hypothetical protein
MLQPGWLRKYIFPERFQGEQSVLNSENVFKIIH